MKGRYIRVMGKGDKERVLPFSARTGKALWRYLATRENDDLGEWLFVRRDDMPFDRYSLLKVFRVIGKRPGVRGVNIHRFRHTFAINFLRNGGDPWSANDAGTRNPGDGEELPGADECGSGEEP